MKYNSAASKRIFLFLIVVLCFDIGHSQQSPESPQNANGESPKNKLKNTVFLGGNYSQFRTTNGVAKSGMNFGYYRQSHVWKQFVINYGIMYTKKRIDLLDKKIRLPYEYSYREGADIHLNYNIIELNVLGSYAFQVSENVFISPVIGVGYAIFGFPRSNIDANKSIYQDDPVEDYDYRMAPTDGPLITYNSGRIHHLGLKMSVKRYYGMLNYTNYLKILSSIGASDLILNEKIHSFNFLIGICF